MDSEELSYLRLLEFLEAEEETLSIQIFRIQIFRIQIFRIQIFRILEEKEFLEAKIETLDREIDNLLEELNAVQKQFSLTQFFITDTCVDK